MPQVKCPMCATLVAYTEGFPPVCPSCRYSGPLPTSAAWAPASLRPNTGPSLAVAIVALVLNLVIWPGLGSLVGGRVGEGLAQGLLFLLGVFLFFTIFLIPISILLWFCMWVWGLVTGIQLIQQADRQRPAAPPA